MFSKSDANSLLISEQSKKPADLACNLMLSSGCAQAPQSNGQFTRGDVHGNTLSFLRFLEARGVVTFTGVNDSNDLPDIYSDFDGEDNIDEIPESLVDYKTILERAKYSCNPHAVTRFLGDEIHDRGNCDGLTLIAIEHLSEHDVPMEDLISNHSAYALDPLFKGYKFQDFMNNNQGQSLGALQLIIGNGIVTRDEIDYIFFNHYIPQLKLLSYSINDVTKVMSIYSHAPIGVPVIKAIAEKLNVPFDSSTQNDLAATIEMINIEFQKILAEAKEKNFTRFDAIYTTNGVIAVDGMGSTPSMIYKIYPLEYLTWNRDHTIHTLDKQNVSFAVQFVHGHTFKENCGAINLDNNLGKSNLNSTQAVILAGGTLESGLYTDYYTPGWSASRAIYKLRRAGHEVTRDMAVYLLDHKDICQQLEEKLHEEKIEGLFKNIEKLSEKSSSSSVFSSSSSSSFFSSSSNAPHSSSSSSSFSSSSASSLEQKLPPVKN